MKVFIVIWIVFDIMFKCWITDTKNKENKLKKDLEQALSDLEDSQGEVEHLKEVIEDIKRDIEDNYRPVPVSEQVGISERDFM